MSKKKYRYVSFIPGIVFHCTSVSQNGSQYCRCKLSTIAIALYAAIVELAGDDGICSVSKETLREMITATNGQIASAKWELSQPMEQLNGKPLVIIEKKRRKYKDCNGYSINEHILVVDVTNENKNYMSNIESQPVLDLGIFEEYHNPQDQWRGGEIVPFPSDDPW